MTTPLPPNLDNFYFPAGVLIDFGILGKFQRGANVIPVVRKGQVTRKYRPTSEPSIVI